MKTCIPTTDDIKNLLKYEEPENITLREKLFKGRVIIGPYVPPLPKHAQSD
jgi:hypothetical protein